MANVKKDLKRLIREAEKQGWRVKPTTKGWMLYSPDGEWMETLHRTPSDWRSLQNTISRMRKHGFKWEGR
jgi:hypothetical protein